MRLQASSGFCTDWAVLEISIDLTSIFVVVPPFQRRDRPRSGLNLSISSDSPLHTAAIHHILRREMRAESTFRHLCGRG